MVKSGNPKNMFANKILAMQNIVGMSGTDFAKFLIRFV